MRKQVINEAIHRDECELSTTQRMSGGLLGVQSVVRLMVGSILLLVALVVALILLFLVIKGGLEVIEVLSGKD